jgi:hypothetical protein
MTDQPRNPEAGDALEPVTYFWDFFGPDAAQTALHFDRHLAEFLSRHGITGCETGTASSGEGHAAAYCTTPPEACSAIERALRPRRRA